jgi:hypothetical protein
MPDASTQTTKGKKIKLIKKPVSMKKLVKVWFDKTYNDCMQWNMLIDMCEEEFGISINADHGDPDISDYLYTLYKENQPDDSSDEENEEKCCICGTDEEVHSCWECDRYICIDCDGNEMATYGEECHTYCEDCGEKVEE